MDELRESSLLFSLEGLMETERERVQREAREAQKRREEELQRVAEMAERRRQAAQQEREARERRQALEQERERLEHQHIEAIKQATVERARIEAEARVRLVEVEQARKHELELSQLRARHDTAHYRTLTWLSTGALGVAVAAGLAAYFGFIAPAQARAEQQQAQLQRIVSSTEEQAKSATRALDAERRKNEALGLRLKQLESDAAATAAAAHAQPNAPQQPHGAAHGSARPLPSPRDAVCVDDGDPLNHCLRASPGR